MKSLCVVDVSGKVESVVELDPWGGETERSVNPRYQPYVYGSYERDGNGVDEALLRSYQGWWARFDEPDAYEGSYDLTDPQSFNRYSYVGNDPVNFTDPSGLFMCSAEFSFEQCGGWAALLGGYFGDDYAMYYDLRDMSPEMREAYLRYEYQVNNAFYGSGGSPSDFDFSIYYGYNADGSLWTRFYIFVDVVGDSAVMQLSRELNRYPIGEAVGALYGGSVVAGLLGGFGLAGAGADGTITLGVANSRTATAALARVEAIIAKALENPQTRGWAKRLIEHRDKLADYARNPFAHDSKGLLRNAPADRAESIILGRVKHLVQEIKALWENITKNLR